MTTAYDELEQAWRREQHNSELQSLRQGFYKDLASYARRLREAQRNVDAKSLKAVVIEEELHRLDQLLTQFLHQRLAKLWSQVSIIDSTGLEYSEKQAHHALLGIRRDYDRMKDDLLQGREPTIRNSKTRQFTMIRFVKDVPSIIGVDLKTHGPFLKEDIARLPQENAEGLVRQGVAVEIRASNQDNE
ncbi:hypothetical protein J2P12_05095 [Candidatus Bathyarchaeota archaeon]|nr:hypothetical protein [Candidatus Bathyarchaeota archaeon]